MLIFYGLIIYNLIQLSYPFVVAATFDSSICLIWLQQERLSPPRRRCLYHAFIRRLIARTPAGLAYIVMYSIASAVGNGCD